MLTPPTHKFVAKPSRLGVFSLVVAGIVVIAGIWGFFNRGTDTELPATYTLATISVSELADAVVQGKPVLVLDVRTKSDFLAGHIPNAISMPTYDLLRQQNNLSKLAAWPTVIVCAAPECSELTQATRDLRLIGFQDLRELEGGFAAYASADLSLASQARLIQEDLVDVLRKIEVPTMTVEELKTRQDIFFVDTRTPYEFVTGFIPGAVDLPLYATDAAINNGLYPKEKIILVYDRQGNRSRIAAQALLDAGYTNIFSLEGGIEAWTASQGDLSYPAEDGSDLSVLIPLLDQPLTNQ